VGIRRLFLPELGRFSAGTCWLVQSRSPFPTTAPILIEPRGYAWPRRFADGKTVFNGGRPSTRPMTSIPSRNEMPLTPRCVAALDSAWAWFQRSGIAVLVMRTTSSPVCVSTTPIKLSPSSRLDADDAAVLGGYIPRAPSSYRRGVLAMIQYWIFGEAAHGIDGC